MIHRAVVAVVPETLASALRTTTCEQAISGGSQMHARAGFRVELELGCLFAGGERSLRPEMPRFEPGGVGDSAFVVLAEAGLEIAR
jgi:hypothetical protein